MVAQWHHGTIPSDDKCGQSLSPALVYNVVHVTRGRPRAMFTLTFSCADSWLARGSSESDLK